MDTDPHAISSRRFLTQRRGIGEEASSPQAQGASLHLLDSDLGHQEAQRTVIFRPQAATNEKVTKNEEPLLHRPKKYLTQSGHLA